MLLILKIVDIEIGAPDWDTSKKDTLFTDTNNVSGTRTITSNGYLLICYGNAVKGSDGSAWIVSVNDVNVIYTYCGVPDAPDSSVVVPVSVGDVVSWDSIASTEDDTHAVIIFYPAK